MSFRGFGITCVEHGAFKDTERTTLFGKHMPISRSKSSNSIQKPNFLCNLDPCNLVSSFLDPSKKLSAQTKTYRKMKFLQIKTSKKTCMYPWSIQSSLQLQFCYRRKLLWVLFWETVQNSLSKSRKRTVRLSLTVWEILQHITKHWNQHFKEGNQPFQQ